MFGTQIATRADYNQRMTQIDAIRAYYERNTRLFLRFGSSKEAQTIHRALWMHGNASLPKALNTANELILAQAVSLRERFATDGRMEVFRIADLGCGVGASLAHVLTSMTAGVQGAGLTISPLQARLGGKIFQEQKLPGSILEADFQRLPLANGFHLAYAVESFVHAIEPEWFLAEAARILHTATQSQPGGRLILIDDFLGADGQTAGQNQWLDAYQQGWQIKNLEKIKDLEELASRFGFRLVENRLLNPYLRLRTVPDVPARILLKLFEPVADLHPIIPSMLGSMALQKCLQSGLVEYRWVVFERV